MSSVKEIILFSKATKTQHNLIHSNDFDISFISEDLRNEPIPNIEDLSGRCCIQCKSRSLFGSATAEGSPSGAEKICITHGN